jgi:hypothetical protein
VLLENSQKKKKKKLKLNFAALQLLLIKINILFKNMNFKKYMILEQLFF